MIFDVLSRHFSVFGPHFLEASAGTGKTFAIEHFVARLLLESEDPLLLEQILVVTFTRAATRELKGRIRHNLIAARDQLQSGLVQYDYLKAIVEEGREKIDRAIRRLEDALACFDSAQIFTIHGFCYRALSEFAFEAGVNFQLNDPDDMQHLRIIEETIHQFLLHRIDRSSFSSGQVAQLWRHFKKKPERLMSRLASLVSQNKEIAESKSFNDSFESWKQALLDLDTLKKEEILADWALLSAQYRQMGNPRFSEQMEQLALMLETKSCTPTQFDRLLKEKEIFLEKMQSSNVKVKYKSFNISNLRYNGLLEQLHEHLLPILIGARDPMQTFLRLARDSRQEIKARLKMCNASSPDDLLRQVYENLCEKKFVESIRSRYRAAIIDEFQDTDPLQWDIFETLFVSHMRSVCLVGDPKQSIYAFRNADLYTYLKAADALGKPSRKYLDTNYRSTPSLVAALNRLFASERTKKWMNLPHLGISLDVFPVKAGKQADGSNNSPTGSIHFFAAEAQRPKQRGRWPSDGLEQTAFFPYIAQEILQDFKAMQALAYCFASVLLTTPPPPSAASTVSNS